MCLSVAARVPGTLVNEATRPGDGDLRLGHPSGVQRLGAEVTQTTDGVKAEKVIVYRTARRLMEGAICVPESIFSEVSVTG